MHQTFKQLQIQIARMQTGGDWALRLPVKVRQNLVAFFYDGVFASASDSIYVNYLVIYLLALGATQAQIGLMSSLSSLTAAILLMPGALLVERIGHRKDITVWGGGIGARLMVILLAGLPFLLQGPALIFAAIAASVIRDMLSNLAYPAWMALTGEIVPIEGRGRYFASRNFAMAAVGVLVTFLAGNILIRVPQPVGYQGAMAVAFVIGMCGTYSFWRIQDPHTSPVKTAPEDQPGDKPVSRVQAFTTALADLRTHPDFLILLGTSFVWNFSLNVAGPFFTVHMVKNLGADANMVGITSIASTLSTMLLQRKFGELNDRWGSRKLQMVSGLLIPVIPCLWVFVQQPWHIIPLNIIGGILWGAFGLANFNYLLALTPQAQRARYSAFFQITVTISLAIGAAVGSVIVTHMGYLAVFIASGIGRMVAAVLFARFSKAEEA